MLPIVIIPARLAATRLPGKPLAEIGGRPMILHVVERATAAGVGPVVVASGDLAITEAVNEAGYHAVPTDPALPTGSDRVHAAMHAVDPRGLHDVVVNLQGDLPTVPPAQLRAVLAPLERPGFDIATLVAPIESEEEARSDAVVKAACAFGAGEAVAPAVYFSRGAVPWGAGPLWHHVGIYAFRRAALDRFVALPASALEARERLEQLRALEAGMRIGVARVETAPRGVDTPEDLARVRAALAG
jgi:3-deoxy-manno-octulosonate cytidylyltransferase (CMP-KDO synthetase)